MRLTQIKLSGFKSFVDPTTIPVPSQLVGVVGPNGCGKSNIIDAVRWVLGETKASELRGESMQDVIFNGSGNRKPAARASVELVFDNSEGRAAGQWSTYAEIAVRRVLTKEGNSSYYINNQQVRRRDINDIFLGTGLGAKGYAIIGQGMINRLIEAKPEELRIYLEEAAGVSRYKERRRETENRLADTRDKLLRVGDIMAELETQLEKLEKQATVAQKYRSLQNEGEEKQQALWFLKEENAQHDLEKSRIELAERRNDLEKSIADLRAFEHTLEESRQASYGWRESLHEAQTRLYQANTEVATIEAQIKHVVDSRQRLQQRKQQLQQQMQDWQEQLNYAIEQTAKLDEEVLQTQEELEAEKANLEEMKTGLPDFDAKRRELEKNRESLRESLAKSEQELALLGQKQSDLNRHLQALEVRNQRIEAQLAEIGAPDLTELARLEGALSQLRQQKEEALAKVQELEYALPEAESARQQAQQEAQQQQAQVTKREARLTALMKLQEDVQNQGALEQWLKKHELSGFTRLWQKLQVQSTWATALESVLRERMNGLELRQLDMAKAFEKDAPPARLSFYETSQMNVDATVSGSVLSLDPLIKYVSTQDQALQSLLKKWLANIYVVEDMSKAMALRASLPDEALLVLPAGHLLSRYNISFYAPDSEQSGMLARQLEIENLQRDVKATQLLADTALSKQAQAEQSYQSVVQALGPSRHRLADINQHEHKLELELTTLKQRIEQADEQVSRLKQDLEDNHHQEQELKAQIESSEIRFEELDLMVAEQSEKHEEALIALEQAQKEADDYRQRQYIQEQRVREMEFNLRAVHARIQELGRNKQTAEYEVSKAQNEMEGIEGDLFVFDEQASEVGLQQAMEERAIREQALETLRLSVQEKEQALKEKEEQRMRLEQQLEPLRESITEIQLKVQAAELSVAQFAEQIDAKEIDRAALRAKLSELPDSWKKVTWLQQEVQQISRQIEALGAVNLAALEELQAAQERQNYLTAQNDDLTKSIQTLENAIREIDRETRQLLQSTFDEVNGNLAEMFPKLFGGGQAKLIMTGDEILNSGVQIMAQPPGKRNSTIYLLSGGEKALTAIALVFSLFKLNPAPFCLLDEVDAPLDDANTERYANLVSSMSDHTQFLFISHNKIAMQMAKQLVGVTMQEQGVSRIVAVDIEAAIQLANEA
ncbi:chromosome segregation protein SMC [Basilea psittacipulmonis]|uniref:Chromosome partition protein Smc n=1 Tax=Basilea psittacipulmonis DSM 24701 TaxID=1072685 RepID=A0A077DDP3_9BURK|nr:chromosome segregation protein SMC [Basilea psittacipulmonis]AIL32990.1 chromosome segregation protein SMC [Basilea psittacipulmonis DSM 24701]